ncbi:NnrS family protein [Enterovirga sp. GCM10030262]|uniref:NnrS family protein n=1 Tax=Enterovirga sp. GCM10030262 TaxID=3273391 RepID=UPI00361E65CC
MRLPPIMRGGFRPFFLGGALWALIVVGLWIGALSGAVTLPTAFDPLAWHRHEMLFGYLGAVIAGFLMTAIPNWTGRLPIAGSRLAALAGLWLAARLAVLFSGVVGSAIALALDVGFLLVLAAVCAREVIAAKNRNFPIVMIILLFAIANAIDHAEALGFVVGTGLGWRAGFALVLMLITVIGGRIIPSFTRNWLSKQGLKTGLPGQPDLFDKLCLAATAIALAGWAIVPDATSVAVLLIAAGAVQAVRLGRWSGHRTLSDPLVLILHVAYAWLSLGLLLLGTSILVPAVPATSGLHALAAGAMASMTLAVMTRATLGHTGRILRADLPTVAIFVLVTLGAAVRVAAPLLPLDYMRSIQLAGLLWGGAFLLFVLAYGPRLVGPRPDGRA